MVGFGASLNLIWEWNQLQLISFTFCMLKALILQNCEIPKIYCISMHCFSSKLLEVVYAGEVLSPGNVRMYDAPPVPTSNPKTKFSVLQRPDNLHPSTAKLYILQIGVPLKTVLMKKVSDFSENHRTIQMTSKNILHFIWPILFSASSFPRMSCFMGNLWWEPYACCESYDDDDNNNNNSINSSNSNNTFGLMVMLKKINKYWKYSGTSQQE